MLNPTSPRPLYLQLADLLKHQIETGEFPQGARLDSEPEIAARYEVARGTVRQALDVMVEEGLLERIQGKGTFVAHKNTAACINRVGVIVPYLNDNLTVGILRGVESVLRSHEYSLIYSPSEGDLELEREQIQRLQRENVCGLILMPVSSSNEAAVISQILPSGVHLVVVDRVVPGLVTNGVFVDNYAGAMLAVRHLLSEGYHRIACISESGYVSSVAERVRGYEDAMRQAGWMPLADLQLEWQHVHWDCNPPVFSDVQLQPVFQFVRTASEPAALFCVNDFIACGVMNALLRAGIRIPEDVALAGFDDIPLAAYLPVPLTTVAQPRLEIGRQAAQQMVELIQLPGREVRKVVLPVSLVVRSSSKGRP
jgi:GntR family transcriptional regulator of arabinose operon